MSIAIVFITHNRVEYSRKSFQSLLETSDPSDVILIVDNASTDGTGEWIDELIAEGTRDKYPQFHGTIALGENKYPGFAANRGWEFALKIRDDCDLLMRADNDLLFLDGWRDEVYKAFEAMSSLGQLGLLNQQQCFYDSDQWKDSEFGMPVVPHTERDCTVNRWWSNIGGPNVIRRELWDMGLRYDETPWHAVPNMGPTPQEDVKLSLVVANMGYFFANMLPHRVEELSFGNTDDYYDYYCRTFTERGHPPPARTLNGLVIEAGDAPVGGHGEAVDHI